ncbi:MAG: hypothetical protein A3E87_03520 [Gammaproteobacteria bacterium RIFCSPHIGHO2_12_FULL_35_23]|nr:MAG: hypothetical protein A3E87_03520 [Gammaproteobacteria bacterium RIFCSPHIGHO2_12_FULL_35_23]
MIICPCGSNKTYDQCCGPYITNLKSAPTPESLMRSRYTAYTQANIDYIQRTMQGKAALNYNPEAAKVWAKNALWLGLTVIAAPELTTPTLGCVEFFARYQLQKQKFFIHEISEFHLLNNCWYYVNGQQQTPLRNSLCPCQSGKKLKHCCGK